jgi:acetyltransferase-like isoleucine patch superfamily enzyme
MKYGFANNLIGKLGRKGYKIDDGIKGKDLGIIFKIKFIEFFRGVFLKVFLKDSSGIVFKGRHVKILHKRKVECGKTLFLGDYVFINALSKNGIQIGDNVSIHRNTIIDCTGGIRAIGEGLIIGNNVGFSPNCYIQVRGQVVIGNNVIFGPGASIFSETHNHTDPEKFINEQGENRKGVVIENGVWVGAGATILDGVRVGANSIIAAKSLVNKDVPPFSIVGGIPAKILKNRKE